MGSSSFWISGLNLTKSWVNYRALMIIIHWSQWKVPKQTVWTVPATMITARKVSYTLLPLLRCHITLISCSIIVSLSINSVEASGSSVDDVTTELESVAIEWECLRTITTCSCATPFDQFSKKVHFTHPRRKKIVINFSTHKHNDSSINLYFCFVFVAEQLLAMWWGVLFALYQ